MADQNKDPREGWKGGALEGALPRYYEPTVTAVTDMVVPATRIQWGPTFAGLLVTLGTAVLFLALGLAIGLAEGALFLWSLAFGAAGLFFGSMLAAVTAKAGTASAVLHGIIIWTLLMMLDVLMFGDLLRSMVLTQLGFAGAATAEAAVTGADSGSLGLWFFVGYVVMLAAAALGGVAGANRGDHHEETEA